MPIVKIITNVPSAEIPADFDTKFIKDVSAAFGKPEKFVVLELTAGAHIVRGGDAKHARGVHLLVAAGKTVLDAEHNEVYAQKLTTSIHNLLKVDNDHILITFHAVDKTYAAAHGETFDHILQNLKK